MAASVIDASLVRVLSVAFVIFLYEVGMLLKKKVYTGPDLSIGDICAHLGARTTKIVHCIRIRKIYCFVILDTRHHEYAGVT